MPCIKKNFLSIMLFCIGLLLHESSAIAYEKVMPIKIRIQSNEQVTISLSRIDINRIFVECEKITAINAPSGYFVAHNDEYGSIYANVYVEKPFTAFITTNTGRHFSLLIVPKAEPGKTIDFIPEGPVEKLPVVKAQHHTVRLRVNQHITIEKSFINLVQDAVSGKIPPGYTAISHKAFNSLPQFEVEEYFDAKKQLKQQLYALYLGGDLAVRVISVENMASHSIQLESNQFYHDGIRAVAIKQPLLLPQTSTQVIEVMRNV